MARVAAPPLLRGLCLGVCDPDPTASRESAAALAAALSRSTAEEAAAATDCALAALLARLGDAAGAAPGPAPLLEALLGALLALLERAPVRAPRAFPLLAERLLALLERPLGSEEAVAAALRVAEAALSRGWCARAGASGAGARLSRGRG